MPLTSPPPHHLSFSSVSASSSFRAPATFSTPCYGFPTLSRGHGNPLEVVATQKPEEQQSSWGRREILVGANAAAITASLWNPIIAIQTADAADLTQRIQRGKFLDSIREKLRVFVLENQSLIPAFLQLALNDAATYDKESKTGGPNGSIRFSSELERPENKGLATAVGLLEALKKDIDAEAKGGPITWADLFQISAQSALKRTFLNSAIAKCGGNVQKGETMYTAYGSTGQWGQFDKQLGRSESDSADPGGRVLLWEEASVADIKARFAQLGFKPRQVAVLSAFLGTDQLATEAKLATDPELAPWVEKYQRSRQTVSQTDYEVDLITAFTRLSTLGQTINYEAYTYAPPPLKLKL